MCSFTFSPSFVQNPMAQQMMQNNPQMAAMLENPEFLRQLSDPNTLQQVSARFARVFCAGCSHIHTNTQTYL